MTRAFTHPQLTVAISLFNYGSYIERALQSVVSRRLHLVLN